MARRVIVKVTNLQAAARELISAHAALREGVATHAEKHDAALDASRKQSRMNKAIRDGIAKNAKQV